jgi:hypothetical protein
MHAANKSVFFDDSMRPQLHIPNQPAVGLPTTDLKHIQSFLKTPPAAPLLLQIQQDSPMIF